MKTGSVPVQLKYTEYKDKDHEDDSHTPVILLHGLLGSKRNFASLGTSLTRQLQKKRRVLALDLRNHGENEHDWRDTMSYNDMAEDVLRFLNDQELEKAILVGHMKVAQTMALLQPHRVEGLVVLDIAPVKYDRERDGSWKAVSGIIDTLTGLPLENTSKRELDVLMRQSIEDAALRAFVFTNLEEDRATKSMRWKINLDAIAQQMHVLADFDIISGSEESQTQYHGDTFFINGGASRFIRSSHMETIGNYFPNHMLTTIRGAGHWVHAEAPDNTLALLKRYLDR
eukprot:CAMPEP_0116019342 /NCGR_PEP_ID=MMETSP0321-20121206/9184_1 /TAXON_ID=163516 /ORGANISM="Leptocylindrus danicus var. danicus, Strain B650" /LENGTH=284 /DNA_ID=CAMNT_0003489903 /DNA_START=116 /DNA_END=971 /DNA_ORIENTATION=+